MRVIGGEWGGRHLVVPRGRAVRPTSDRVREAMFDMLEARDLVDGARVVDLFAGSGALGLEALSRGAAFATFVDTSAEAVAAIRGNLATLDGQGPSRAKVVQGEALRFLAGGIDADLVLCDPPYAFTAWEELLGAVRADWGLFESRLELESQELAAGGWVLVKGRRYGTTLVTLARRARPAAGCSARREIPEGGGG